MTKELFVSSTPHETKVGMVEDDLLAEIYLERENEYTLAGSIYKGRVTRVLPGMQSAFVDIGLERDAFLYVSDFMELEDSEDLDDVPTNRPPERYQAPPQSQPQAQTAEGVLPAESPTHEMDEGAATEHSEQRESSDPAERDNRDGMRGRRRRRGRRGERFPESKFARPATEAPREAPRADLPESTERTERHGRPERSARPERSDRFERTDRNERPDRSDRSDRGDRGERSEYGPPPGYQPIILPGESISKYQRMAQNKPASFGSGASSSGGSSNAETERRSFAPATDQPVPPLSEIFATDEPLFADSIHATAKTHEGSAAATRQPAVYAETSEWDRQQKRLHEMNVAAVFGREDTLTEETEEEEDDVDVEAHVEAHVDAHDVDGNRADISAHSEPAGATPVVAAGTLEEEEIEEEEADLAHYVEDLEEDASFEEIEEETLAAGEHEQPVQEIAASAEVASVDAVPFSADAISSEEVDVAAADDVDEEAEDEAELDQAQAEAEAALAAEAGGAGLTEARAEVRAPAGTAGYTQRGRVRDMIGVRSVAAGAVVAEEDVRGAMSSRTCR